MKPLTPRRHGIVDYASCALMLAAPSLLGLNPAARRTSALFAGSYLLVTALTDFPLGVRRMIPFPVHGKIELASAPALLALPALLGGLSGTREGLFCRTGGHCPDCLQPDGVGRQPGYLKKERLKAEAIF